MKVVIFCYGLEKVEFGPALSMVDWARQDLSLSWRQVLNSMEGLGYYAAGAHIIHFWITEKSGEIRELEEVASGRSLLFRLCSQSANWKAIEGEFPESYHSLEEKAVKSQENGGLKENAPSNENSENVRQALMRACNIVSLAMLHKSTSLNPDPSFPNVDELGSILAECQSAMK